jgi:hypothetical protein
MLEPPEQSLSTALIASAGSSALISDIPKFDGEKRNFAVWRDAVELGRHVMEPEMYVRIVKQKLGIRPAQFIATLGDRSATYEGLMKELANEYDEYGKPVYAHKKFSELRQGERALTEHHSEVYALVRGMRELVSTQNYLLKSGYIQSLTSFKLRLKLTRMIGLDGDHTSLEDLMITASQEDRLYNEVSDTPATAEAASVIVAAADQKRHYQKPSDGTARKPGYEDGKGGTRFNNKPGSWCDIHKTATHDIAECRSAQYTNCRRCRAEFAPGEFVNHMKTCPIVQTCYNCHKDGHIARFCKAPTEPTAPSPKKARTTTVNAAGTSESPAGDETTESVAVGTEETVQA